MQNYSREQTYRDIKNKELALYDFEEERCVVRPCLSMTLLFKHGARDYVKEGLSTLFDILMAQYGEHLRYGMYDENRYAKKTKRGMVSLKKYIVESDKSESTLASLLSSAKTDNEAPEYSFETFIKGERTKEGFNRYFQQVLHAGHDGGVLSGIKIILPIGFLASEEKLGEFEDLLHKACELLPVFAGYAGLSSALPYDSHRYLSQEYATATQFSGLDIDTLWYLYLEQHAVLSIKGDVPNLEFFPYQLVEGGNVVRMGFIKNVTWYNIVPKAYFKRIGGYDANACRLSRDDVTLTEIGEDKQSIIIKAGDSPQLGSKEQGLPEVYVFVNKVLKHLRDPTPDALQYDLGGVKNANKRNSTRWQERFDVEAPLSQSDLNGIIYDPNTILQQNQTAQIEGYYKDPMIKEVIYLRSGDVTPSYPLDKQGNRTQIYVWNKLTAYGVSQIPDEVLKKAKGSR